MLTLSCSFSHSSRGLSNQNECDYTQVNHTLNNWWRQYCFSLVGLPNLSKRKRLLLL